MAETPRSTPSATALSRVSSSHLATPSLQRHHSSSSFSPGIPPNLHVPAPPAQSAPLRRLNRDKVLSRLVVDRVYMSFFAVVLTLWVYSTYTTSRAIYSRFFPSTDDLLNTTSAFPFLVATQTFAWVVLTLLLCISVCARMWFARAIAPRRTQNRLRLRKRLIPIVSSSWFASLFGRLRRRRDKAGAQPHEEDVSASDDDDIYFSDSEDEADGDVPTPVAPISSRSRTKDTAARHPSGAEPPAHHSTCPVAVSREERRRARRMEKRALQKAVAHVAERVAREDGLGHASAWEGDRAEDGAVVEWIDAGPEGRAALNAVAHRHAHRTGAGMGAWSGVEQHRADAAATNSANAADAASLPVPVLSSPSTSTNTNTSAVAALPLHPPTRPSAASYTSLYSSVPTHATAPPFPSSAPATVSSEPSLSHASPAHTPVPVPVPVSMPVPTVEPVPPSLATHPRVFQAAQRLLAGLSQPQLTALLSHMCIVTVPPHTRLFRQGDDVACAYVVMRGAMVASMDRAPVLQLTAPTSHASSAPPTPALSTARTHDSAWGLPIAPLRRGDPICLPLLLLPPSCRASAPVTVRAGPRGAQLLALSRAYFHKYTHARPAALASFAGTGLALGWRCARAARAVFGGVRVRGAWVAVPDLLATPMAARTLRSDTHAHTAADPNTEARMEAVDVHTPLAIRTHPRILIPDSYTLQLGLTRADADAEVWAAVERAVGGAVCVDALPLRTREALLAALLPSAAEAEGNSNGRGQAVAEPSDASTQDESLPPTATQAQTHAGALSVTPPLPRAMPPLSTLLASGKDFSVWRVPAGADMPCMGACGRESCCCCSAAACDEVDEVDLAGDAAACVGTRPCLRVSVLLRGTARVRPAQEDACLHSRESGYESEYGYGYGTDFYPSRPLGLSSPAALYGSGSDISSGSGSCAGDVEDSAALELMARVSAGSAWGALEALASVPWGVRDATDGDAGVCGDDVGAGCGGEECAMLCAATECVVLVIDAAALLRVGGGCLDPVDADDVLRQAVKSAHSSATAAAGASHDTGEPARLSATATDGARGSVGVDGTAANTTARESSMLPGDETASSLHTTDTPAMLPAMPVVAEESDAVVAGVDTAAEAADTNANLPAEAKTQTQEDTAAAIAALLHRTCVCVLRVAATRMARECAEMEALGCRPALIPANSPLHSSDTPLTALALLVTGRAHMRPATAAGAGAAGLGAGSGSGAGGAAGIGLDVRDGDVKPEEVEEDGVVCTCHRSAHEPGCIPLPESAHDTHHVETYPHTHTHAHVHAQNAGPPQHDGNGPAAGTASAAAHTGNTANHSASSAAPRRARQGVFRHPSHWPPALPPASAGPGDVVCGEALSHALVTKAARELRPDLHRGPGRPRVQAVVALDRLCRDAWGIADPLPATSPPAATEAMLRPSMRVQSARDCEVLRLSLGALAMLSALLPAAALKLAQRASATSARALSLEVDATGIAADGAAAAVARPRVRRVVCVVDGSDDEQHRYRVAVNTHAHAARAAAQTALSTTSTGDASSSVKAAATGVDASSSARVVIPTPMRCPAAWLSNALAREMNTGAAALPLPVLTPLPPASPVLVRGGPQPAVVLDAGALERMLGPGAAARLDEHAWRARAAALLSRLEQAHATVFCVCGRDTPAPFRRWCVEAADKVLVAQVADHLSVLPAAEMPPLPATGVSGGNPALERYCPLRLTPGRMEHELLWLRPQAFEKEQQRERVAALERQIMAAKARDGPAVVAAIEELARSNASAKTPAHARKEVGSTLSLPTTPSAASTTPTASAPPPFLSSLAPPPPLPRWLGPQMPLELVLLHPAPTRTPLFTRAYLCAGSRRFDRVLHVRLDQPQDAVLVRPRRMWASTRSPAGQAAAEHLQLTDDAASVDEGNTRWTEEERAFACTPLLQAHLRRICRHLVGNACGLVLSGGGARGLAHLGVLRALLEAGAPVDMIAGTSQGACMGAVFAATWGWGLTAGEAASPSTVDVTAGASAVCGQVDSAPTNIQRRNSFFRGDAMAATAASQPVSSTDSSSSGPTPAPSELAAAAALLQLTRKPVYRGDGSSEMEVRTRNMGAVFGSLWGLLSDATLPILAFFSGQRFNDGVLQVLGGASPFTAAELAQLSPWHLCARATAELLHVEDLWIPYVCVSTNVSRAEAVNHDQGLLWLAVRASMAILTFLPPVRAHGGDLLIDGGYIDNLPVAALRRRHAPRHVFASDVENKDEEHLQRIAPWGYSISGVKLMLHKLLRMFVPSASHRQWYFPAYGDIVGSLVFLTHNRTIREVAPHIDLYLRPPVQAYKLLDYHRHADLVAAGYARTLPLAALFMERYGGVE